MRYHNVPRDMQRHVQRWYDYAWSRLVSQVAFHTVVRLHYSRMVDEIHSRLC